MLNGEINGTKISLPKIIFQVLDRRQMVWRIKVSGAGAKSKIEIVANEKSYIGDRKSKLWGLDVVIGPENLIRLNTLGEKVDLALDDNGIVILPNSESEPSRMTVIEPSNFKRNQIPT